jgi:hypothetical protein
MPSAAPSLLPIMLSLARIIYDTVEVMRTLLLEQSGPPQRLGHSRPICWMEGLLSTGIYFFLSRSLFVRRSWMLTDRENSSISIATEGAVLRLKTIPLGKSCCVDLTHPSL